MERRTFLKSTAAFGLANESSLIEDILPTKIPSEDPRPMYLFGHYCEACGLCYIRRGRTIDQPDGCSECGGDYGFFTEVLKQYD